MKAEKRVAIFKAALEVVGASFDAHGYAVAPFVAWDFITTAWYEDERPEYAEVANLVMPLEFLEDYMRLIIEYRTANKGAGVLVASRPATC